MRKISFYRKVKLFKEYLNILKSKRNELEDNFNSRIDWVGRIYTVVNVPVEAFGDNFNLRKSDIDKISNSYIVEYNESIAKYLNSIGLIELYREYSIEKVGKYNYKVVYGYSLFRSDKLVWNIIFKVFPALLILSVIIFFYFF